MLLLTVEVCVQFDWLCMIIVPAVQSNDSSCMFYKFAFPFERIKVLIVARKSYEVGAFDYTSTERFLLMWLICDCHNKCRLVITLFFSELLSSFHEIINIYIYIQWFLCLQFFQSFLIVPAGPSDDLDMVTVLFVNRVYSYLHTMLPSQTSFGQLSNVTSSAVFLFLL